MLISIKRLMILALLLVSPIDLAQAQSTQRVTILYTTDIHDHLLPGPDGIGGFATVATFIDTIRSQRENVIVVDAGDATEKGDLAAFLRHGSLTYELMNQVKYDVATVGNHEENFGLARVVELDAFSGHKLTAVNLRDREGNLLFQPFRIFGDDGRRVGIIGAALPSVPGLGARGISTANNIEETAVLIRDYATILRTRHDVDLVIVVIHDGLNDIRKIAAYEPDVDVFIAGHSHTNIEVPVVVNKRGSVVVQSGNYANHVGVLDLEFKNNKWVINNAVVPMLQSKYAPHKGVMDAIAAVHAELDFDPLKIIGSTDEPLGFYRIARLASTAVREHYKVDIAFIHPSWIVRNILHAGRFTANDIFKTMSDRAEALVRLELTGAQIEHYMIELANKPSEGGSAGWGQTLGTGFRVISAGASAKDGRRSVTTDLQADRRYSVIMTRREWDWRFARMVREEKRELPAISTVEGGTFRPLLTYIRKLGPDTPLAREANRLAELFGRADPQELVADARTIEQQTITDVTGAPSTPPTRTRSIIPIYPIASPALVRDMTPSRLPISR